MSKTTVKKLHGAKLDALDRVRQAERDLADARAVLSEADAAWRASLAEKAS